MYQVIVCDITPAGGEVPMRIRLMPIGKVHTQKGDFLVDDESCERMKNAFRSHGVDIVIDYEHQTLDDVQAPAAGWIKELSVDNGALIGDVEWTEKAKEYIRNGEYRYLSPVVRVNKKDNRASVLHSVALTNTPAIDHMFTIAAKLDMDDPDVNPEEGEKTMEWKELAKLLGLQEDASEEQVREALGKVLEAAKGSTAAAETEVVANKTICSLLGIPEDAKTEDAAAAIMALKGGSETVSKAEYLALKERMDRQDAGDAVIAAMKAGKISAAQREWAMEYALKDPKGFDNFVEKAPAVVPMGELQFETDRRKPQQTDETTLAVCKMLGLGKEDIEKYGKDEK